MQSVWRSSVVDVKVSLITACYNSAEVIETALESVWRQDWPEIEYLVIDGGSSDGTVELIKRYEVRFGSRMRWLSEPDRGMYDALNKGMALATGEVVGILNADDVLSDAGVVRRVVAALAPPPGDYRNQGSGCDDEGKREAFSCATAGTLSQPPSGSDEIVKAGCGGDSAPPSRDGAEAPDGLPPEGGTPAGDAAARACRPPAPSRFTAYSSRLTIESGGDGAPPSREGTEMRRQGPAALQEDGARVEVVYGDVRFVANRRGVGLEEIWGERTVRWYAAKWWRPWMLQWGFMPPHPSVYIRREAIEALGGYALDYEIAADYALLVRYLRRAGLKSRYVEQCCVDMRLGGRSTRGWRANLVLNREIVRANREAGYFCWLPMLTLKYLFKIWEFLVPGIRRGRSS